MQYLILSDIHLGCTAPDTIAKLQLILAENKDRTIVWNGDTVDLLMFENAYQVYDKFVQSNDIKLVGNHDYDDITQKVKVINTPNNNIFITHGDLVDFGLGFKLLETLNFNTIKMLLRKKLFRLLTIILILRLCRKWSINDCHVFYKELIKLSDEDVGVFHHTQAFKLKNIKAYLKCFSNIVSAPRSRNYELNCESYETCIIEDNKYWGLITHDPVVLLERTLLMYPECESYDTIIIGHIHHKADRIIKASNGKEYRFIILGAWVGDVVPTYITLDSVTGELEVIEISNQDE